MHYSLFFYILFIWIQLCSSGRNSGRKSRGRRNSNYDITIIGGGFSGLYLAMRLGQASDGEYRIAILESTESQPDYLNTGLPLNGIENDHHACLGGRVLDYPFECDSNIFPNCPEEGYIWMGDHAVRLKTSHGNFQLGNELGFIFQQGENSTYGEAEGFIGEDRGFYFVDRNTLMANKYQEEIDRGNIISDDWIDIYLAARQEANLERMCNNEFFHTYEHISDITGSHWGYELLMNTIRFKSPFDANSDPQGLWEWIDTDEKSDEGWTYYPEGGMSEFIRRMYQIIVDNNYADIYCGKTVKSVSKHGRNRYKVSTKGENGEYYSDRVIITVAIPALHELGERDKDDNLVRDITRQVESRLIEPQPVFTCSQQFEEKWYEDKIPEYLNHSITKVDTWYSSWNCMTQIEHFNSDYLRGGNLIRSMYVDKKDCVSTWASIYTSLPKNQRDNVLGDLIRERHAQYFGVDMEEIPEAIRTHCEYSDHGWHFIKATANNLLGNNPGKHIEEWAYQPLENENIHLCGETYANRRGWTDGARAHCDVLLHEYLGVSTDILPQYEFSLHERAECSALCDDVADQDVCNNWPSGAIIKH